VARQQGRRPAAVFYLFGTPCMMPKEVSKKKKEKKKGVLFRDPTDLGD
jgi:hypothetical protein